MAASLAQQKKKMRNVMERMKKKYGVVKLINKDADIAQCLYLVLREGWDYRKATKALKKISEEYVDWNEVRVSYNKELCETIAFVKYADIDKKVERIKEILQDVFNDYNSLDFDFLVDMDFEEILSYFLELTPLGKSNSLVFLQCLQDGIDGIESNHSQTLVMSTDALRVGVRLGLIKKTSSHNVARKEFSKILDPSAYFEFQNRFVRHGEELCRSKNPLCKDCFLNSVCKYYKP